MIASNKGNADIVKALLSCGAKLDGVDDVSTSPLFYCYYIVVDDTYRASMLVIVWYECTYVCCFWR